MTKVCIVGSAPSSVKLQPYNDPSWKIWACSPGSTPHLKRVDAFFEIHRWEPHQPWFPTDYRAFLASLQCPVYMIDHVPDVPKSVPYPKDEMIERFGPWFWTSTISWMFALAIKEGATEIALAGIDMSAQEEWAFQRSGCHFFIQLARELGITVTVPPESDLLRPPPMYGFREVDPMHIKLLVRDKELTDHIRGAEQEVAAARDKLMFYKGAYDNNLYMLKTWVSDPLQLELAYKNPDQPKVIAETATHTIKAAPIEGKLVYAAEPVKQAPKNKPKSTRHKAKKKVNGVAGHA